MQKRRVCKICQLANSSAQIAVKRNRASLNWNRKQILSSPQQRVTYKIISVFLSAAGPQKNGLLPFSNYHLSILILFSSLLQSKRKLSRSSAKFHKKIPKYLHVRLILVSFGKADPLNLQSWAEIILASSWKSAKSAQLPISVNRRELGTVNKNFRKSHRKSKNIFMIFLIVD